MVGQPAQRQPGTPAAPLRWRACHWRRCCTSAAGWAVAHRRGRPAGEATAWMRANAWPQSQANWPGRAVRQRCVRPGFRRPPSALMKPFTQAMRRLQHRGQRLGHRHAVGGRGQAHDARLGGPGRDCSLSLPVACTWAARGAARSAVAARRAVGRGRLPLDRPKSPGWRRPTSAGAPVMACRRRQAQRGCQTVGQRGDRPGGQRGNRPGGRGSVHGHGLRQRAGAGWPWRGFSVAYRRSMIVTLAMPPPSHMVCRP